MSAEPAVAEPTEQAVLELDRLSLSFGGLRALSELDLRVADREVVSVIGPNGAGKTSVFNVITGVYQPSAGNVRFAGTSIAGQAPHVIARRGIARTFQSLRLFMNMSVLENVMAATYGGTKALAWESILRLPRARREEREVRALAEDVLSFFGQRLAGYRWDQPAYSLSYANRRRLEIARALATRPRLLLLDEPAAGMNPIETHEITELIGRLREERGVAILVIEHDMHVVAGCSDRVVALDHGVKIAEGGFDQVANHPAVEVFIRRGLIPEAGGLLVLPRLVGLARAYELILSGDIIDAAEAERIGMVNKVVPHAQLGEATAAFAKKNRGAGSARAASRQGSFASRSESQSAILFRLPASRPAPDAHVEGSSRGREIVRRKASGKLQGRVARAA